MCGSEKATFSNEKEAHTMDFYRVLEDYSLEAFLDYEKSASMHFPIIDDTGTLMLICCFTIQNGVHYGKGKSVSVRYE